MMNKDDLIMLQEFDEESQLDDLVECQMEDMKIQQYEENIVLLQNLLKSFTEEQLDILSCLVDNEIKSNEDFIKDIKGKEQECWEEHNSKLKDISVILQPLCS